MKKKMNLLKFLTNKKNYTTKRITVTVNEKSNIQKPLENIKYTTSNKWYPLSMKDIKWGYRLVMEAVEEGGKSNE